MSVTQDFATGTRGEAAFMRAMTEQGYVVLNTDAIDDIKHGLDVRCMRHTPKGVEPEGVETMDVDVKCTAHPVPPEKCFESGYNSFMVEWKSGPYNFGTPISDTKKSTTHLAYVTRAGEHGGRMPFYLVSVEDVRSFYLTHRDDERLVKLAYARDDNGTRVLLDHARNINMKAFADEYGFEFYSYDGQEWTVKEYGKGTAHYVTLAADNGFCELLSSLNGSDKRFFEESNARPEEANAEYHAWKKEDAEKTAARIFHGDTKEWRRYTDRRPPFEPEYKPKRSV